jgi:hypothetical protein
LLNETGVTRGSEVAFLGDGRFAAWARLARLRIIAEVPALEVPVFWAASAPQREATLDAMRQTGAKALISSNIPSTGSQGWHEIGSTSMYIHWLTK